MTSELDGRDDGGTSLSRRRVLAAGTAALASLAGCSGGGSGGSGQTTETSTATGTAAAEPEEVVVRVGPGGDFVFSPGTEKPVRLAVGTTVRFVWDSDGHNVVVDTRPSGSDWAGHRELESAGFESSHTFQTAGEYRFFCEPHRSLGMEGTLVVE